MLREFNDKPTPKMIPSMLQRLMRVEHKSIIGDCTVFYDPDGLTIYVRCSDGWVKITPKGHNKIDVEKENGIETTDGIILPDGNIF